MSRLTKIVASFYFQRPSASESGKGPRDAATEVLRGLRLGRSPYLSRTRSDSRPSAQRPTTDFSQAEIRREAMLVLR